ncbi:hypothetical protein [Mycolicibacterium grossiae]|uniref:Serine/threonine protein kinase n=1 Tax=Mycolicibacterium grossiae TaxID=1552759 RepID=A0A1E8PZE7_9MYCO|nr:hypothetical protein [Mycolicibacterium grossiae]OFJ51653.1 hypothetical protein BEL07_21830 [Mycolicibacterium grossiae]QEM44788.1 hypothetical protein FZ046_08315 [Mycolicibacterium grossiae]
MPTRQSLATAAGAALLAAAVVTVSSHAAMPRAAAAPESDAQGYVDSTARCASPNTPALFGTTDTSRIAICQSSEGEYQYRGVRVRDGARLILSATRNADGAYLAENGPISYLVTAKSLVVSEDEKVVREEKWVDFHGSGAAGTGSSTPKSGTGTSGTSAPTTTSAPATTSTKLPPPLPAEVGG